MKEPKRKQLKKEPSIRKDIRHLGVLIERVDDDVKLVAEQYGDIKKDINSIKETLDSHTETLNSHTETLNSHTGKLDSHTEMIGNLAMDVTIVKRDVEIMKTDIEFIKSGLKKKVDIDEFSALEKRVLILERRR